MTSTADLADLLESTDRLAHRAGEAILEVYRRDDHQVRTKDDDSPLTEADLRSHRILEAGLTELTPEIPVLSEEGAGNPYDERRGWRRFWLVDPLDGTKEFIKRNGEFTVNIALIEDGTPVLGVVHAPTLGRTYAGAAELGAWRRDTAAGADGGTASARRPLRAAGSGPDSLVVAASRSHAGPHLRAFLDRLPDHRLISMGSSLKLCLVADGAADVYPRLGPTMEWDTAAADAVVRAAGGRVLDFAGRALRYNKEDLHNPHFIVLGEKSVPWQEAFAATGSV